MLVLDSNEPKSLKEIGKKSLHGIDGQNRWWDKQQIIVFNNGKASLLLEHTPVDGHSGIASKSII